MMHFYNGKETVKFLSAIDHLRSACVPWSHMEHCLALFDRHLGPTETQYEGN